MAIHPTVVEVFQCEPQWCTGIVVCWIQSGPFVFIKYQCVKRTHSCKLIPLTCKAQLANSIMANPFHTQTELWKWGQQTSYGLTLPTLLGTAWDSIITEENRAVTVQLVIRTTNCTYSVGEMSVCGNRSLHTAPHESYKLSFWPGSWHKPHLNSLWSNFHTVCLIHHQTLKHVMYFILFLSRPTLLNWAADKGRKSKANTQNLKGTVWALPHLPFGFPVCVFRFHQCSLLIPKLCQACVFVQ